MDRWMNGQSYFLYNRWTILRYVTYTILFLRILIQVSIIPLDL